MRYNIEIYNEVKEQIIRELKENPKTTIPEFVQFFNEKHNTNYNYIFFYNVIRINHLWKYIIKSREHQTLYRLLENQDLKELLFKYSGLNLTIKEITEIIYEELGFSITNYALKRLISFYNLDYKERNLQINQTNPLTERQKLQILHYCKQQGLDFNNLSVSELFRIYKHFKYSYLEYVIFKSLNTNK